MCMYIITINYIVPTVIPISSQYVSCYTPFHIFNYTIFLHTHVNLINTQSTCPSQSCHIYQYYLEGTVRCQSHRVVCLLEACCPWYASKQLIPALLSEGINEQHHDCYNNPSFFVDAIKVIMKYQIVTLPVGSAMLM